MVKWWRLIGAIEVNQLEFDFPMNMLIGVTKLQRVEQEPGMKHSMADWRTGAVWDAPIDRIWKSCWSVQGCSCHYTTSNQQWRDLVPNQVLDKIQITALVIIGSCAFRTTKFSCSDFNLLCNTRNRWSIHHREHLEAQVNGYFDLNQLFYRTCCRSERFEMNHTQEKMPFWGATTHFSSLPNRTRTASEPHPNRTRTASEPLRFGCGLEACELSLIQSHPHVTRFF